MASTTQTHALAVLHRLATAVALAESLEQIYDLAITALPGFSVCRHAGDFDLDHPEVKVEFLLQLTQTLTHRVDAALFGLPGRAHVIRRVLARAARELKLDDDDQLD